MLGLKWFGDSNMVKMLLHTDHPALYATAWVGYIASVFTADKISIAAGIASLCVSISGIVVNLIKIYKSSKNEKDY